ncbi:hypothetical protein [Halomicrococcus gelatinilyticus]|uniref:hypothetical protein n=1 Tax=Halomicrococcus gelatinilyticus TaxID=1702103 RepID=UPI002E1419F1
MSRPGAGDGYHDPAWYPALGEVPSQRARIERREWDVLTVLDDCRWDYLTLVDEAAEMVRTPAEEATPDWTTRTWDREGWEDVTYISGNPFTTYAREAERFGVVLEERVGTYVEAFRGDDDSACNDLLHCTRPDRMTDLALAYLDGEGPPLVVHYLQPHVPYVGDVGVQGRHREPFVPDRETGDDLLDTVCPAVTLFREGEVSGSLLRHAYLENLKLVWRESERLRRRIYASDLTGVVTADHGEVLGPDRWGHGRPEDPRARIVPWLRI